MTINLSDIIIKAIPDTGVVDLSRLIFQIKSFLMGYKNEAVLADMNKNNKEYKPTINHPLPHLNRYAEATGSDQRIENYLLYALQG